ncbi:hypothetical protein IB277_34300 [Ensifer sp. ENS07]|uniref:hypothetical protein n=1 Tax=Ensifer sp. ENS07 TaxID=2769274 RepID=UPI00177F5E83|nr:hypothetical protein [Ensifer sp. ENS07]MBD9641372.1 hypothetical protein [Ensifer sp. ENS07]
MKTPWKYLVELASRGRTDKAAENPPETEAEDPADEVVDPIVEALRKEESSLDVASSDTAVAAVDEEDRTSSATVEQATVDPQGGLPEPVGPPQPAATKRRRPSRKTGAVDVAVSKVAEYGDGSSGAPQPPMTFVNEMATLDEDIRQLRRQLAEKLRLQNTQLKKMLGRYDTP